MRFGPLCVRRPPGATCTPAHVREGVERKPEERQRPYPLYPHLAQHEAQPEDDVEEGVRREFYYLLCEERRDAELDEQLHQVLEVGNLLFVLETYPRRGE